MKESSIESGVTMNKPFVWGVATASYQIEGHKNEFKTIWDSFATLENRVYKNQDGELACNHVDLFEEDIKLIKNLGVDSYRLSISWARIIPNKGEISRKGLEFYKTLLKRLKEEGISPMVTMYHWDMPNWIYEENGGWISRQTVNYFIEYAKLILSELDPYVDSWTTFNEPYCSCFLGYCTGDHAPGHRNVEEFIKASHYLMLAHGEVIKLYREMNYKKEIGIVINLTHVQIDESNTNNYIAYEMQDALNNQLYLDMVFKGKYPKTFLDYCKNNNIKTDFIEEGDMELISQPIDKLGINYYTRALVEFNKDGLFNIAGAKSDKPKTDMGWDIYPKGLKKIITRLREEYTDIPLYITENGAAFKDELINGEVDDKDRISYFRDHIDLVLSMKDEYNIKGYYVWSLLDNYEWAFGYSKRFGIVYVDYNTFKRTPKASYYYLKGKIQKMKKTT